MPIKHLSEDSRINIIALQLQTTYTSIVIIFVEVKSSSLEEQPYIPNHKFIESSSFLPQRTFDPFHTIRSYPNP